MIIEEVRLVDLIPNLIIPTYRNGRQVDAIVAKWLDIFLMEGDLLDSLFRDRS